MLMVLTTDIVSVCNDIFNDHVFYDKFKYFDPEAHPFC